MSASSTSIRIGAVLGALGVALGAFGAHALRGKYAADLLEHWDTAVRYQLWHALALLLLGALDGRLRWHGATRACFAGGVLLFSGSLYVLVLTGRLWLGAVTPIGGILLIAGWALLAAGAGRTRPPA
jgi:uncharacterized membrane protein YgdD (TMEM256/DUF423 family)